MAVEGLTVETSNSEHGIPLHIKLLCPDFQAQQKFFNQKYFNQISSMFIFNFRVPEAIEEVRYVF